MNYKVNNIYPCIQGEGVLTGTPMIMLRLQGCPVGCSFCDTKETWDVTPSDSYSDYKDSFGVNTKYWEASPLSITNHLVEKYKHIKWVLISGGEPAIADLTSLVTSLHNEGFKVALETSGTAIGFIDANIDWVCISPKIDRAGGLPIINSVFSYADEIKHVIGKEADLVKLDNLLEEVTLKKECIICLQPMSQSKKATEFCIETVMKRGYRLSVQVHKYLQID